MSSKQKNLFVFDRTLRELFQEVPSTLIKLLINKEIKEILDTNFPKTEERRVDLLAKLEDDSLFHLEIQSTNDKEMPLRMIKYALLIYEKYKLFPYQLVLYVGKNKLQTKNYLDFQKLSYNYDIKDIREFNCHELIDSPDINDNIIALLCRIQDVNKLLVRLSDKLKDLNDKKRDDYVRKVISLMKLRNEFNTITKEGEDMPFVFEIDLDEEPIYKEAIEKGLKEGMQKGMQKGMQEGLEKGLEEGLEKGKKEEQIAIAKSMLLNGLDIDLIVKITGLDKEKVESLKQLES